MYVKRYYYLLLQIRVSHFSVPLAGEFDLDMATPHG